MSQTPTTRIKRGATLLQLTRGGYGVVQLAAPALIARRLLGRPLDAHARAVARILGARQLAQATASGRSPSYPVLALGVEVDLLHAPSMLALALADRRRRSTALLDAWIAGSFVLAGALAARTASTEEWPAPSSPLAALRQRWADALACALVPGYPTRPAAARRRGGTPHLTGSMQGTLLSPGSSEKTQK